MVIHELIRANFLCAISNATRSLRNNQSYNKVFNISINDNALFAKDWSMDIGCDKRKREMLQKFGFEEKNKSIS